ncbi:hypothetical protein ASF98_09795 [Arthrobacter sp. Leaf337]|uniref:hypothetical protein n=2 Tax=unclassified Arthrobacter TaxID=235627 RepID=UPI000700D1FE|nr:hypothetical protein [Arthrobacter sp. Leaf337]KQR65404.1 hypothetical protein ASF98_09795 [Arthrobacter sp. Leaf337]
MPFGFILALATLPLRSATKAPAGLKRILLFAGIGSASFVLVCVFKGVEIPDSNVGQSLSFAIFLFAFSRITTSKIEAAQLLAWFTFGQLLYYLIARPENTLGGFDDLWKYGIAYPVGTVLVYIFMNSRAKPMLIPMLILVGIASIFWDYRSMGLVCMLSAVAIYVKGGPRKGRPMRAIVGGIIVYVLSEVLPSAMKAGYFGLEIQQRTIGQTLDDTPAILGGRTESPLSIAMIMREPLFGWGNVQSLDPITLAEGVRVADFLGMHNPAMYLPVWIRAGHRVSLHSIFFTAWVEGGVLGVLLPVAILAVLVLAIIRVNGAMMPIVVFASLHGIWDLFFSPWGGNQSIAFACYTILALWSLTQVRTPEPELEPTPRSLAGGTR